MIQEENIAFEIPGGQELEHRLNRTLEVIYLIFNEGFHSNRKDILVREDLCGEAMRLSKTLLSNPYTATPASHAIFSLFCFQAARLRSKINDQKEIVSLQDQDRSTWYQPLIVLGHKSMKKAVKTEVFSHYHYEAAIAAEHTQATSFATTNWDKILKWYQQLHELEPSPLNYLNMAVVQLQRKDFPAVKRMLESIQPNLLEQRAYLYYGTYAAYAFQMGQQEEALGYIEQAIGVVENEAEFAYLSKKKIEYQTGKLS